MHDHPPGTPPSEQPLEPIRMTPEAFEELMRTQGLEILACEYGRWHYLPIEHTLACDPTQGWGTHAEALAAACAELYPDIHLTTT